MNVCHTRLSIERRTVARQIYSGTIDGRIGNERPVAPADEETYINERQCGPSQQYIVLAGWGFSIGGVDHVKRRCRSTKSGSTKDHKLKVSYIGNKGCDPNYLYIAEPQVRLHGRVAVVENDRIADGKVSPVRLDVCKNHQSSRYLSRAKSNARKGRRILRAEFRDSPEA